MILEALLIVATPKSILLRKEGDELALPTLMIGEDDSSLQIASYLLREITGLQAKILNVGFVDLIPCPLADSVVRKINGERVIGVPYVCFIPEDTTILRPEYSWVKIYDLLAQPAYLDHLTIIRDACTRL